MKTLVFILLLLLSSVRLVAQLNETEPNDNFAQANLLPVGMTMTGVTCAFPEKDYFMIILPQDGILRVNTSISANDPNPSGITFTLFSKNQNQFNDLYPQVGANSIAKTDSLFWGCLSADTMFLEIFTNGVGFGYCFSYTFSYTVLPPTYTNDSEPNDNFAQALPLSVSTVTTGHLGFSNNPGSHLDQDFYRVILPTDGIIRVITSIDHTSDPNNLLNISLFSKTGNVFNDQYPSTGTYGNALEDTVYWGCLSADTMYLKLFIADIFDCGFSYRLRYDVLSPVYNNDTEPNNTRAQALPLPYNTTMQGHLGFTNNPGSHIDEDFYRVILPQDGIIAVVVSAEDAASAPTQLNFSFMDKNGNQWNDQYPPVGANHIPLTDTIYWGCIAADTFYLRAFISNVVDCGITYSVKFYVLPPVFANNIEPNENFSEAVYVPLNTDTDGHLGFHHNPGFVTDEDFYKIFLPSPSNLKIIVSAETPGVPVAPMNMTIYNSSRNPFTFDRYPVIGSDSIPVTDTFDFGCLAADTFFLKMFINNIVDCGVSYRLRFLAGAQLLNLGNDTAFCGPVNLTLNAGSGFLTYQWSTGATSQTINVTDSGYYWVSVTSSCGGPPLTDTIHITRSGSGPPLQLPGDTTVCNGIINIPLTVPAGFTNILWSTGSTSQQITATGPGTYWVRAESGCGIQSDTMQIFGGPVVLIADSVQIIYINTGDSVVLTACATGQQYNWQSTQYIPCSTCNSIKVSPVQNPAQYTCLVGNTGCGITCRYIVNVVQLTDGMAIPNAFTPNDDGINDVFRIIHGHNIFLHYFKILNRYGEELFSTSDFSKGWDGTFKGKKQASGTYVYIISADKNGFPILKQGTVLLIR